MTLPEPSRGMEAKIVDGLHAEALILADEARSYFERAADDELLTSETRVIVAAEGLRLTTRLMFVIAWLLRQKALAAGEMLSVEQREDDRLGPVSTGSADDIERLPEPAKALVRAGIDLHERIARLDEPGTDEGGARALLDHLQTKL